MNQSLDFLINAFSTTAVAIPLGQFILDLLLTGLLAYALGLFYVRYGSALSNRRVFAKNFILLSMTTMVIITVVQSSLALSLGLVGALSIVRFRAAIKEPEELAYLFLNISIGLGLGAGQRTIVIIALVFILSAAWTQRGRRKLMGGANLIVTISGKGKKIALDLISEAVAAHSLVSDLRRYDEAGGLVEIAYSCQFEDISQVNSLRKAVNKVDPAAALSILENRGIM